ncbi:MAG: TIGR01777 family oxidoreductase [Bacteroidota bacterium]
MKIIIFGANGFMGQHLLSCFSKTGEVIAVQRTPGNNAKNIRYVSWDGKNPGAWCTELEGADLVINLAGKSVDCRYTEANKAAIFSSRLDSTRAIGEAIGQCRLRPKVWINAASATIYRHSFEPMTESHGIIGEGFSVEVCKAWEKSFFDFRDLGVRQIALRTSIVLGNGGGVMGPFKNLVKFGFGGKMGDGKQIFSWIHIEDVCRAISFLAEHENCSGVYNIAAPNPIPNAEFMHALRKRYHRSFGIPLSKSLLEFGAKLIGTETELILKSRYVIPKKLVHEGFQFKYLHMEECLEAID